MTMNEAVYRQKFGKIAQGIRSIGHLHAEMLVKLSVLWAHTPAPAPMGVKFGVQESNFHH